MDFGTDWRGNQEEFLRSGTKIVVGGQAPSVKKGWWTYSFGSGFMGNDRWNFWFLMLTLN